MLLSREFLSALPESHAQTTMKRAHPHIETLQVLCITPLTESTLSKDFLNFQTGKYMEAKIVNTCELYQLLISVPILAPMACDCKRVRKKGFYPIPSASTKCNNSARSGGCSTLFAVSRAFSEYFAANRHA